MDHPQSQRAYRIAYDIGADVYHRLEAEKVRGIVTGLMIRPGSVVYFVTWPDRTETQHYAIELSTEYIPDYERE